LSKKAGDDGTMAYIIENINILKKERLKKTSILVAGNRIEMIKDSFQKYRCVRMDGSPYIMTPTTTILDNKVTQQSNSKKQKQYIEENLIKKGCTTFLTSCQLTNEKELHVATKKIKNNLLNSAIDYVIGVQIPMKILTPSFIRLCKKEKIPVIFIEIKDAGELARIPWGWIKESMFPYNPPLVPIFLSMKELEKKNAQIIWASIMREGKIPSINKELKEGVAISSNNLVKMGIYPFKGNVYQGGEVTYNLYEKSRSIINIEENQLFLYHNDRIQMTVHHGECIRAGDHVYYRPGFGEHIGVKVPSYYTLERN
jgi:hypothetical protein